MCPKKKKKDKQRKLVRDVLTIACQLDPTIRVSEVIAMALRYNPKVMTLNKTDETKFIQSVYHKKDTAKYGLKAFIEILDDFENKLSANVDPKWIKIDGLIMTICRVARNDFREVNRILFEGLVAKTVKCQNFWCFFNETFKISQNKHVSWMSILQMNTHQSMLTKNYGQSFVEFLVGTVEGFDVDKMIEKPQWKGTEREAKKKRSDQRVKQKTPETPVTKPKVIIKNKNGEMWDELRKILNEKTPGPWPRTICAFFHHPKYTCREGAKCKFKHLCPFCGEAHQIQKCKK